MADFEELNFSYLGLLSNAHHDGTTQQIDDAAQGFETENATFIRKSMAVHQARLVEDEAWKKSQVDPVRLLTSGRITTSPASTAS